MIRSIVIAAGLFFSIQASAGALQLTSVDQEMILMNPAVKPVNGGINPSFIAYEVSGRVQLASNSCDAEELKASLEIVATENGQQEIVARIKGERDPDRSCAHYFLPIYADVAIVVRGDSELIKNTFIRNADELGNTLPLFSFIEEPRSCSQTVFCSQVYQPVSCTLNGHTLQAGNRCQALEAVKQFACENDISYSLDEVTCTSLEIAD